MTPEGKVKKRVTDMLKANGVWYFCPMTGGYGKSGAPDIIACHHGRMIGIECKAGAGKTTALQEATLAKMADAGALVRVVNEHTWPYVKEYLEHIFKG